MSGVLVSDPATDQDDATLVAAALRTPGGDAFRLLYERHAGEVLAFLRRLSGERTLAEDLLQETFLRVHQHLEGFDRARPFRPWLFQIARNAAFDALRRRDKGKASHDVYEQDPSQSDPVLKTLAAAEAQHAAERALVNISDESRALLLQRHGLGLTQAELAQTWGVSERTIRTRLRKAIQALTRALLHEGGAQ